MMDRLDANSDGVLSADEIASGKRAERRFDRVDQDGDGAITKAEFDAAREHMGKRRRAAD
jgi:Ca2+-binding EF-hand superfamily protein